MSDHISSVSRIPILITLNKREKMEGELIRHLSPLTIKKILSNLPVSQLVNNFHNKYLQIKLDLNIGIEKPQSKFKRGDLAYSPSSGSIYIFLNEYVQSQQYFSHIGYIKTNMEILEKTKAGDVIFIQKI